jgi:hypothetical protein
MLPPGAAVRREATVQRRVSDKTGPSVVPSYQTFFPAVPDTLEGRMLRLQPSRYVATLSLLGAAACAGPTEPASLVGTWVATTLAVAVPAGPTVDALGLGASVRLELRADGTTAGRFVLPALPGFSTDPVDTSLAGTWEVTSAGRVRLSHPADTFLQDLLFLVDGNELRASFNFQDAQQRTGAVTITLTRQ